MMENSDIVDWLIWKLLGYNDSNINTENIIHEKHIPRKLLQSELNDLHEKINKFNELKHTIMFIKNSSPIKSIQQRINQIEKELQQIGTMPSKVKEMLEHYLILKKETEERLLNNHHCQKIMNII